MNACSGLFGRLFGHNYVAYYDEEPTIKNIKTQAGDVDQAWMEDVLNASRRKLFRASVCQRCGHVSSFTQVRGPGQPTCDGCPDPSRTGRCRGGHCESMHGKLAGWKEQARRDYQADAFPHLREK